jgi:cell division transport system permease protein
MMHHQGREAWRSFVHHRGLATTAVLALTAAFTLAGLFLLLSWNAEQALRLLGDRREMVVYLRDDVDTAARDAVVVRLQQLFGSVTYVSKEQAWDELVQQIGDRELLESVDENPLPASLRVRLKPELLSANAMDEAARQVKAFTEVEDVRYGAEWVRRLDELSVALRRGTLATGIAVALACVFVLVNLVRLLVLTRRRDLEIMLRLGASDRFIAPPFLIEALMLGLAASLLALLALFAVQRAVAAQIPGVVFLPWTWAAAFVGTAVVLAWAAAAYALSRVLRSVGP